MFDIIPQDQMKKMFGQMMENEQFSIKLVEVESLIFHLVKSRKLKGKTFCFVGHNNVMAMKFKEPMEDEWRSMVEYFKSSMEADNVTMIN